MTLEGVHRFFVKSRPDRPEVIVDKDGNKTYLDSKAQPRDTEPTDDFSREIARLAIRLAAFQEAVWSVDFKEAVRPVQLSQRPEIKRLLELAGPRKPEG